MPRWSGSGVDVVVVVIVAAAVIVAALGNGNATVGVADTVDDPPGFPSAIRRHVLVNDATRRVLLGGARVCVEISSHGVELPVEEPALLHHPPADRTVDATTTRPASTR